jgi:putative membrane protein
VTVVVWIFAFVAAVVHLLAFTWETLLFQRPGVHQGIFAIPTADVASVRLWAFNVGFYNLFIACGLVGGVIVWMNGNEAVGQALVIYLCLFAFLAGIALFASDRLAMSRPRGTGLAGSLAQSVPPLIALTAALL